MQSLNTCRRSTLPGPLPPVEVVRRTLELVKKAQIWPQVVKKAQSSQEELVMVVYFSFTKKNGPCTQCEQYRYQAVS